MAISALVGRERAYAFTPPLGEGIGEGAPSLDNYVPKLTVEEVAVYRNRKRKRKRAYQRIKSGLAIGGNLLFITLTSSPASDRDRLGRDFSNLVKKLRRGSSRDPFFRDRRRPAWKFEYARVRVPGEGYGVLHIIARGSYIPQRWLSQAWNSIRNAPIVDIRAITRTPDRVGNYLITQYVSNQEGKTHLSWSWCWVYRGFCKDWSTYKKQFRTCAVSVWILHLRAFKKSLHEWEGKPPPIHLGVDLPDIRYSFGLPPPK